MADEHDGPQWVPPSGRGDARRVSAARSTAGRDLRRRPHLDSAHRARRPPRCSPPPRIIASTGKPPSCSRSRQGPVGEAACRRAPDAGGGRHRCRGRHRVMAGRLELVSQLGGLLVASSRDASSRLLRHRRSCRYFIARLRSGSSPPFVRWPSRIIRSGHLNPRNAPGGRWSGGTPSGQVQPASIPATPRSPKSTARG
jgi:hypothetical protein